MNYHKKQKLFGLLAKKLNFVVANSLQKVSLSTAATVSFCLKYNKFYSNLLQSE